METKTHWKKLINPDYIGAYSLDGKDLTVTIEKVIRELVTGTGGKKEECTVAYLKGLKPFILNITNSKMIAKILGTPFIEEWTNKKITIYPALTKLKGEDVECLRVRDVAPILPVLTESHPKFESVKIALKSGNYTIDQIKIKYQISEQIQKLLKND